MVTEAQWAQGIIILFRRILNSTRRRNYLFLHFLTHTKAHALKSYRIKVKYELHKTKPVQSRVTISRRRQISRTRGAATYVKLALNLKLKQERVDRPPGGPRLETTGWSRSESLYRRTDSREAYGVLQFFEGYIVGSTFGENWMGKTGFCTQADVCERYWYEYKFWISFSCLYIKQKVLKL